MWGQNSLIAVLLGTLVLATGLQSAEAQPGSIVAQTSAGRPPYCIRA